MDPNLAKALTDLEELQTAADKNSSWTAVMELNGYKLVCTCPACPEQYDVYSGATGNKVGYLRLRHGQFRADVPTCGGETVYVSNPKGDGIFADDERLLHLEKAIAAIDMWCQNKNDNA